MICDARLPANKRKKKKKKPGKLLSIVIKSVLKGHAKNDCHQCAYNGTRETVLAQKQTRMDLAKATEQE